LSSEVFQCVKEGGGSQCRVGSIRSNSFTLGALSDADKAVGEKAEQFVFRGKNNPICDM
jgi:hypothetical protein